MIEWWIWVLIALGLFIIISVWSRLDSETRSDIKSFLWKAKVPIALIIFFIYTSQVWGTVAETQVGQWKAATLFFFFGLFVWISTNLFIARERYESTTAIADNRHGSCAKYERRGDWVILNIGSIDATAFPYPFGHEVWVCPITAFNKLADQLIVKSQLQRVDVTEVPTEVHDFIIATTGYNKENVYFGIFTLEEKLNDKVKLETSEGKLRLAEYETKLKDTNRMLNEARAMVKGKTSVIKSFVSDTDTILKKAKGQSLLSGSSNKEEKE